MTYKELTLYQLTERLAVNDLFQPEITLLLTGQRPLSNRNPETTRSENSQHVNTLQILQKLQRSLIRSSNYLPKINVFEVKRSKINLPKASSFVDKVHNQVIQD